MTKYYGILPQDSGDHYSAIVGAETVFMVSPIHPPLHSATHRTEEITVSITATDPNWGPKFTRIEGFVKRGGRTHTALGYFHSLSKSEDNSIGFLEVHNDEA